MAVINFQKLWESHPRNWAKPEDHPCRYGDNSWDAKIDNQCAIRMSLALVGAGLNLDKCPKRKCWLPGHKNHVLAAQELADWLSTGVMLGKPKKITQPKGNTLADLQQSSLLNAQLKEELFFFKIFTGQIMPEIILMCGTKH